MKYFLVIILTLSGVKVTSQTSTKIHQTFSKEVDGIQLSIDTPTTFESIDDPDDKNTVLLISKKHTSGVFKNLIKISQKSIPKNFTDEMILDMMVDKNKSIQIFTGMKKSNPQLELDIDSFSSIMINEVKFYKMNFKNFLEKTVCLYTFHKRKMFLIYFTYQNLKEGEMDEFKGILNSLVFK